MKKEICVWLDGKVIPVTFINIDDPTTKEAAAYVEYVQSRIKAPLDNLTVKMCDDGMVDVHYEGNGEKFERIRRITGYLVGTTDRWNNAKQAEEKDRVKHL
jgi:anaerobic ribonucleoside-triphosphate reductase